MNPSSRTPEGTPIRCPVCGESVRIEPSAFPTNDAPCPHCGHLLWFTAPSSDLVASAFWEEIADVYPHPVPSEHRKKSPVHTHEPFDTEDRVVWALMAAVSTLIVWANDGLVATTGLWFLGIVAFGQIILPRIFRRTHDLEILHENLYVGVIMGWGLVPGPPVGVLFGVLLPWVYECGLSSFAGGLVGLIAGPCFAIVEGLIIVFFVDVIVWIASGTRLSKRSL